MTLQGVFQLSPKLSPQATSLYVLRYALMLVVVRLSTE